MRESTESTGLKSLPLNQAGITYIYCVVLVVPGAKAFSSWKRCKSSISLQLWTTRTQKVTAGKLRVNNVLEAADRTLLEGSSHPFSLHVELGGVFLDELEMPLPRTPRGKTAKTLALFSPRLRHPWPWRKGTHNARQHKKRKHIKWKWLHRLLSDVWILLFRTSEFWQIIRAGRQ